MENIFKIVVGVEPTNPNCPLGFEIWVNDIKFFDNAVKENQQISMYINDNDGEHVIKLVLKDKLPEHTKIDDNGSILSDSLVKLSSIEFDGIDVTELFCLLSKYHHNFNGTGNDVVEKFNGTMGCNGTVSLTITTPIYLWLLENL